MDQQRLTIIQLNQQQLMAINQDVISFLNENLTQYSNLDELNLQFMQISDLLPYIELLSQFKNLKKLSLHGNRIKELPIDLSRLGSLQEIDLSNNLIKDINLAIISLKTLPSLQRLNLPVKKEKESEIFQHLRALTHLNNVKIQRTTTKEKTSTSPMHNAILTLKNQFNQLVEIEGKYFQETGRIDRQEIFGQKLQKILAQAEQHLTGDKHISQSQTNFLNNLTMYEMYDLIKKPAIGFCVEICDDLGKLIDDITTIQENLMGNMIEISLSSFKNKQSDFNGDKEVSVKVMQFQKEIKRLRKQKDQLIGEINQLESENKKYLDSLMKLSKGNHPISTINFSTKTQNVNVADKFKTNSSVQQPSASNYHSTGRSLTLKQLKQAIEEIYESKLKFDQKNHDGKLPRQTMHQYLFTHLNQKYGLKNLTIEAANSIVSAIQVYSAEENDVAVFGKILRNQIDEQFRNVQTQLKSTVYNLLKMHIKSQHPYKSTIQINEIYNEKVNNQIFIQQCQDIVKYLYNEYDAQKILQMLNIVLKVTQPPEEHPSRRSHLHKKEPIKRKSIKFALFLQTVLDFQLKNHQKLLKPLINIFKSRDKDADGIVDEDEFIAIIESLCEEAVEIIPELLSIVDPYETKLITFTQMVRLVANYPQNNPILMRFLEKEAEEEGKD